MFDADVLRQPGVSNEIWRRTDFVSNILVLKLTSCELVHKIHQHMQSMRCRITDGDACNDKTPFVFGKFSIDGFEATRYIFMGHYDLVHVPEGRMHYDEAKFGL